MRSIIFTLTVLLATRVLASEPFAIDDYDFTWKVAERGDATLSISKTEETTTVYLRKDYNGLSIPPDEAALIGDALAATGEYYAKLKGANDQSEEISAGGYEVSFSQSKVNGFWVHVSKRDGIMSSVLLDRSQAIAFAPWLQKTPKMAAYLDTLIDGALSGK